MLPRPLLEEEGVLHVSRNTKVLAEHLKRRYLCFEQVQVVRGKLSNTLTCRRRASSGRVTRRSRKRRGTQRGRGRLSSILASLTVQGSTIRSGGLLLVLLVLLMLLLLVLLLVLLLYLLLHFVLLLSQIPLLVEAHQELLGLDKFGIVRRGVVLFHLREFLRNSMSAKSPQLSIRCHKGRITRPGATPYRKLVLDLLLGQAGRQTRQASARQLHRASRLYGSHGSIV